MQKQAFEKNALKNADFNLLKTLTFLLKIFINFLKPYDSCSSFAKLFMFLWVEYDESKEVW